MNPFAIAVTWAALIIVGFMAWTAFIVLLVLCVNFWRTEVF